jgi:hypothetical protein
MTEKPDWTGPLAEAVAACMSAHGPAGPLGMRYRTADGVWDVLLYPMPVEMVGGAHDGGVACPSFSLDLEALRAVFSPIEALSWDAHGVGPDNSDAGPWICVRGQYAGRSVWLRILAYAPADVEPAMKVDATGRRQAG